MLLGWSYFQAFPPFNEGVEFESSGHFRKRDWFRKEHDWLIRIGDRREKPPLSIVLRRALTWAPEVVRTPTGAGGRRAGLAAYTAWADALSNDDDFPPQDMPALRERYSVHNDASGTVTEGRWYASLFLEQAAESAPEMADELPAAAESYKAEHDLMWDVWNLAGGLGMSDEHVNKFAQPATRRHMVGLILQARDKDAEAADGIERALTK